MVETITIPLVNPNEPDALCVKVYVQEGNKIVVGDLLCTLETTKSTLDMVAEGEGFVRAIQVKEGELVKAGEVFAFLADDPNWQPDESLESVSQKPTNAIIPHGLRISQPALRLAQESNLELESLPKDRFVTEAIVQSRLDIAQEHGLGLVERGFDPTSIVIYGAGGHGKSILDFLRVLGTYSVVGFVDDGVETGEIVMGIPVLGDKKGLPDLFEQGIRMAINAVGGIGNIKIRGEVFNRLLKAGFICPAIVHPIAFVEASAKVSAGSQVFPFAYVGSEVSLGFGTIINTGAVVSHECVLGELVNIAPNAILAGGVTVGEGALIGMGVTINLSVKIGEGARIGNGATIKADVPAEGIVAAGTIWPK